MVASLQLGKEIWVRFPDGSIRRRIVVGRAVVHADPDDVTQQHGMAAASDCLTRDEAIAEVQTGTRYEPSLFDP
jgi:hypothetical protein